MFILFILGFTLFFEFYFYQGVKTIIKGLGKKAQLAIKYSYWGYTIMISLFMLGGLFFPLKELPVFFRAYFMSFIIMVTVSKAFATIILFFDDILRVFRWIWKKSFGFRKSPALSSTGTKIGRLKFISQFAMFVAVLPFIHMFFGMLLGAHRYTVHRNRIRAPWVPKSFDGLKIVQISDVHCGSFVDPEPLKKAIDMINEQKPDMVFITGDLVNDLADETDRFANILARIKAPMGVFSCLGNHDYGDYVQWKDPGLKKKNMEKLISRQKNDFGWELLMNENRTIEKNGEKIAIIGVENIGRTERFPRYGDLDKAMKGVEDIGCKLLLSHDPYHYESEIAGQQPEINCTFSGHTHGMQFGIEVPGLKWSPVQVVYKHWAGLLKNGSQYLYVNRGLGYIGYAGRAGIWPEITVHELYHGPDEA